MNIYVVERTDDFGWDEYVSGVIAAESEEQALAIAREKLVGDNGADSWDGAAITHVGVSLNNEARVIHYYFRDA